MGLNLIRFATDPQYRAVKRWRWSRGDERLRLNYDLAPTDVVLDLGAYQGDFARAIAEKSGARVHAFEPVPHYADIARRAVAHLPSVSVHSFGLARSDMTAKISVDGLASSRDVRTGNAIDAEFRAAATTINALAPGPIALLKINIEGDEYELLPALIEAGIMARIRDLQVQFHTFTPDYRAKYAALTQSLGRTHTLTWRYPFIWENWRLKAPGKDTV